VSDVTIHATKRITIGPMQNPVRGLLHGAAAVVAIAAAAEFLYVGGLEPALQAALVAFAATQATLFLTSAGYHSIPWSPRWKRRMQRADHSMIFLAIAGSVTPLALLGLSERFQAPTIAGVWAIAALGVLQKTFLPKVHERASIPVQVAQAALAVPALLGFASRFPGVPSRLALAGMALYAIGALIFVTERPRLWPRVFSFHELFHLLVVAGSAAYYAVMSGVVARVP
jgi:hemolysin III